MKREEVAKLIALHQKDVIFREILEEFFLDNGRIDENRMKKAYERWQKFHGEFSDSLRFNEEFIESFLFNIPRYEKESIKFAMVFLMKTLRYGGENFANRDTAWSLGPVGGTHIFDNDDIPFSKKFPSLYYFIFEATSIDGVVGEKERLKNFFRKEIKEFFQIIEWGKEIAPRLEEFIARIKAIEKKDLEEEALKILQKTHLWEWYRLTTLPEEQWPEEKKELLEYLKYYYPSPSDWIRKKEKIEKEINYFLSKIQQNK
jgi:hypothetical protein